MAKLLNTPSIIQNNKFSDIKLSNTKLKALLPNFMKVETKYWYQRQLIENGIFVLNPKSFSNCIHLTVNETPSQRNKHDFHHRKSQC